MFIEEKIVSGIKGTLEIYEILRADLLVIQIIFERISVSSGRPTFTVMMKTEQKTTPITSFQTPELEVGEIKIKSNSGFLHEEMFRAKWWIQVESSNPQSS